MNCCNYTVKTVVIHLLLYPCRNAILEKASIRKFYDEKYRIERLFFNGDQKVAMANLRGIHDELIFIQVPASRVYILDGNFYMTKALPNIEDRHKIERAVVKFSAIKRAIGMANRRQKLGQQKELCVATPENFLGFTDADSRTLVSVLVLTY